MAQLNVIGALICVMLASSGSDLYAHCAAEREEMPKMTTTEPPSASIGSASMLQDGTIVLDLRASDRSSLGDARLQYTPEHPQYRDILLHLGGMRPGEVKQVPPWPDDER